MQNQGWIAASAAGLRGKGPRARRAFFFTDTGVPDGLQAGAAPLGGLGLGGRPCGGRHHGRRPVSYYSIIDCVIVCYANNIMLDIIILL